MSVRPKWVRDVARRLLAQPGVAETPRCTACARLMAPRDMRGDLCVECTVERDAVSADWDEGPFLPSDEEDAR